MHDERVKSQSTTRVWMHGLRPMQWPGVQGPRHAELSRLGGPKLRGAKFAHLYILKLSPPPKKVCLKWKLASSW